MSDSRIRLLFSYGFRPLFLLATLHALLSIIFWLLAWTGIIPMDWQRIPMFWHGHEMLMGLAAAAVGGFLLTAVANWTGRPPVSGLALAVLCLAWLVGRLSLNSPLLSAGADSVYWLGLWLLLAREIISAGNRRNYKVLLVLGLIAGSDLVFHAAELGYPQIQQQALWAMVWLVIILINVIGGRVIPAFTGNWLRRQLPAGDPVDLPPGFSRLDLCAIVALAAFAIATVTRIPTMPAIALGLIAFSLQTWRLSRWKFHRTGSEPLVWMMHLSYLWIPLGIALWTAALAGLLPESAALHALTIGAISSMIVSIGSRAALGHTGRPLASHPLLTACIVLLSLAAALRVGAAALPYPAQPYPVLLHASGAAWVLAFSCFAWRYIPILILPSQAQK